MHLSISTAVASIGVPHLPVVRKHPVIMPHKLVCEPCWPSVTDGDVQQYWNHLSDHGSPLATLSPNKKHVPLWLWGDEAQFRENGDEILLICMGLAIDNRKYSVESCYPLSVCRSESLPCSANIISSFFAFQHLTLFFTDLDIYQ